jgi:hypothetical protein
MMVVMPRFQSRLFNWIDRSLPAQLGRSVRRSLDQKFRQLAGLPLQELPRLLAYQVAKAALYPVYLIASTAKRVFPALDRSKVAAKEKLRSQPETAGLLSEVAAIAENIDKPIGQEIDQMVELNDIPKPEVPLLLRPFARFLDWIDRTKIQLDRNIAAIVKRQPNDLATSGDAELEPKVIANRIFAEIWRQQIDQAERNALRENNGLAENVALGKNKRLEQLRRLIEAAIAYFFGNQSHAQDQSLESNQETAEVFGTESPETEALTDSPKLKRRRVTSANSGSRKLSDRKRSSSQNPIQRDSSQPPNSPNTSGDLEIDAPLAESTNLDRLRDLIAAAIDYFIGKRSLDGDQAANADGIDGVPPDLRSPSERLQESEFSDALKIDNQLERLQKIIEAAIAYFFSRQRSPSALDETSDIAPTQESWLTMEDVFGDDNGPWPLPLEYESIAFSKSPDRSAIHSSGELQNFETTTTQISQDQLEGSLVFEEELLLSEQQREDTESDRPLRAWIEAKATLWGYSNNPVMKVILWIDSIILKIENLIIKLWKGFVSFPKHLLHFIRYGKK